jgi:hypothetical protein
MRLGIEQYDGIWERETRRTARELPYQHYTFPLVKAIQELSTQLDAALARITTLEG